MKVAAIQMCSSDQIDQNLENAASLIKTAAETNAKLLALPEMFAFFGKNENDKLIIAEDYGAGKIQKFLSSLAKKHGVWIVGGTIPIKIPGTTKIHAACLVYNDQGKCVSRYNKIHLFDADISETEAYRESHTVEAGRNIKLIETPVGNLGLAVCYDVRFPELFRAMVNQGAEIFILPSAFTIKTGTAHWELLTRARAVENFSYIIAPAQGGTHTNGRKTYGHSLIVEPWGNIVAMKNDLSPGVIEADIDLNYLKNVRKQLSALNHQKLTIDRRIKA